MYMTRPDHLTVCDREKVTTSLLIELKQEHLNLMRV